MSEEPVLYDSPKFEHANMAVLYCRDVLMEQGLTVEASKLGGMDVSDAAMARVVLRVLYRMKVQGLAAEAVQVATHLCEQAIGLGGLRVAG